MICPFCKEEIADGAIKCKHCKSMLANMQVPQQQILEGPYRNVPVRQNGQKSKIAAGLFGILLGGLGIHKFYLGQIISGIIYLLLCWTFIPAIIGFIEGIVYLAMSDESFARKYG